MKLKPKRDVYEITYSHKKDPNQWDRFRAEEEDLLVSVNKVLTHKEWQLECVALVATNKPNKHDLPKP